MNHFIIANGEDFQGMYVTTCSPDSQTVISASESPVEAVAQAKETGCEAPVLAYIPTEKESKFIYSCQ